jgi:hypothetical protein
LRSNNDSISNNTAADHHPKTNAVASLQDTLVPNQYTFANGNPKQMTTNAVTKFAFATKTGLAPSNPNK